MTRETRRYLDALKAFRDAALELDEAWELNDFEVEPKGYPFGRNFEEIARLHIPAWFESEVTRLTEPHTVARAALLGTWTEPLTDRDKEA